MLVPFHSDFVVYNHLDYGVMIYHVCVSSMYKILMHNMYMYINACVCVLIYIIVYYSIV